jgi:hypothetical protein
MSIFLCMVSSWNVCVSLVQSPWLFGAVCKQSDTVGTPALTPVWTCGLEVTGNFNCPAGETLSLFQSIFFLKAFHTKMTLGVRLPRNAIHQKKGP